MYTFQLKTSPHIIFFPVGTCSSYHQLDPPSVLEPTAYLLDVNCWEQESEGAFHHVLEGVGHADLGACHGNFSGDHQVDKILHYRVALHGLSWVSPSSQLCFVGGVVANQMREEVLWTTILQSLLWLPHLLKMMECAVEEVLPLFAMNRC